eukprot:3294605-Amphidinium_carterae.1
MESHLLGAIVPSAVQLAYAKGALLLGVHSTQPAWLEAPCVSVLLSVNSELWLTVSCRLSCSKKRMLEDPNHQ